GPPEVVDEQLAGPVGRHESLADFDAVDAVAPDHGRQLRPVEIVPGAQEAQRRKQVLTALSDEWHPAEHAVPIALEAEVARGGGHVAEDLQVGLGSVTLDEEGL